jgi:hypothetical protein
MHAMNTLSVESFQPKSCPAPHPVLAIDGQPLDLWLVERTGRMQVEGLYPLVLGDKWPQNTALGWHRLQPRRQGQHVIVPLLVCPDCLDFACTTLVVQQQKTDDAVLWHRFGVCSSTHHLRLGQQVDWFDRAVSARFGREGFGEAVRALRGACG